MPRKIRPSVPSSSLQSVTNAAGAVDHKYNSGIWHIHEVTERLKDGDWRIPLIATGGNQSKIVPGNGFVYHTFTSSGTFVVSGGSGVAEIVVVAGGGGGGPYQSGGGGGGGVAHATDITLSPGSYPIVVGAGGSTPASTPNPEGSGGPGVNSTGLGVTALGGGRGGARATTDQSAMAGGSGGGAGAQHSSPLVAPGTQPGQSNPAGTTNYGSAGGRQAGSGGGGGGGGAAAVGGNGSSGVNGAGGAGVTLPGYTSAFIGLPSLPDSGVYGGGGGAGDPPAPDGAGGNGGGGLGNGRAGDANKGGGGGGGTNDAPGSTGGNGGSGIVIIRYPTGVL